MRAFPFLTKVYKMAPSRVPFYYCVSPEVTSKPARSDASNWTSTSLNIPALALAI